MSEKIKARIVGVYPDYFPKVMITVMPLVVAPNNPDKYLFIESLLDWNPNTGHNVDQVPAHRIGEFVMFGSEHNIPIVLGQKSVVFGADFYRSLSLINHGDIEDCPYTIKWHHVHDLFVLAVMSFNQFRLFRRWLTKETKIFFDQELRKSPDVITDEARVAFEALTGNPYVSQGDFYIRNAVILKVDRKIKEYGELLQLAAIDLSKKDKTDEGRKRTERNLERRIERYLSRITS